MTGAPLDEHGNPQPVDTLEPPHEPVVVTQSTIGLWTPTLAGPVIWLVYFVAVYLVTEASCEGLRNDEMRFIDESTLYWFVIAATVVSALLCLVAAATAWRRRDRVRHQPMMIIGTMLSIGSTMSVLAIGLPVLALGPC